jgi:hypothetical protein
VIVRIALLVAAVVGAVLSVETGLAHDYVRILSQYQGPNVVVVNYNVDHFQPGVPVRFNFRLYQIADGRPLEFDRVDARFVEGNVVRQVLAMPMSPDTDASQTYTFATPGQYRLQVEFVRGPNRIATADFPLLVEGVYQEDGGTWGIAQMALAFGLGAAVAVVGQNLGLLRGVLAGSATKD